MRTMSGSDQSRSRSYHIGSGPSHGSAEDRKKAETEYKRDRKVLLAPIVSTEKSARVILRYWDRKYQRIPDLLVIEGPLAGGTLDLPKISWSILAKIPMKRKSGIYWKR